MGKFAINFWLFLFLILSLFVVFIYFAALLEKIYRPHIKNHDSEGFVLVAFPIAGILVGDYFIVRRLLRSVVTELRAVKKEMRK